MDLITDLNVKRLTKVEKDWIKRFDLLLSEMPERLLAVECADCVFIVDRNAAKSIDISDGGAHEAKIVLATLDSLFKITSVSG